MQKSKDGVVFSTPLFAVVVKRVDTPDSVLTLAQKGTTLDLSSFSQFEM